MTLSTHTIVAATLAGLTPNHPALGFVFGFASHFALDSIPHWDYHLTALVRSPKNPLDDDIVLDKRFGHDLKKILLDIFIGLYLGLALLYIVGLPLWPSVIVGALGGIIPDALQLVYAKWRHEPLRSLQRFHIWIQKGRTLDISATRGIFYQALLIAGFIVFIKFCLVLSPPPYLV